MTAINHTNATETTRRGTARPGSLGGRTPHPVTVGAHDAAVLGMVAEGKSTAAIGAVFGCDGKTIRMRLSALVALGVEVPEKPSAIHPVSRGMHDAAILKMRANKVRMAVIGREFGCSDRLVADRLKVIRDAQQPDPKAVAAAPVAVPHKMALTNPKLIERRCLGGCGRMRVSEGPGDRICLRCKNSDGWHSGGDTALSGVSIRDR